MTTFTLCAKSVDNSNTKATTEGNVSARFPGVVVFYRSLNQANGEYGKNDKGYDGSFGFDTYLPCLHGLSSSVRSRYLPDEGNEKVKVCFPAIRKNDLSNGATTTDLEHIRLYPPSSIMERDGNLDDYSDFKYKIPSMLIPKDKKSVTIYCKILYPELGEVNENYLEVMNNASKKTQEIKFKLVEVGQLGFQMLKVEENTGKKNEYDMDIINTLPQYQKSQQDITVEPNKIDFNIEEPDKSTIYGITITSGENICSGRVALIAYFEQEAGKGEKKHMEEIIIGQVNIYVHNYDTPAKIISDPDEYADSFDIKFVRIRLTTEDLRETENKKGIVDAIKKLIWTTPDFMNRPIRFRKKNAPTDNEKTVEPRELVDKLNSAYFSQCGMKFRLKGETTNIEIPYDEIKNMCEYIKTETTTEPTIRSYKEAFNKQDYVFIFKGKLSGEGDDSALALSEMFNKKYTDKLKKDLIDSTDLDTLIKEHKLECAGYNKDTIIDKILEFYKSRTIIVYLAEDIDAGGKLEQPLQAYAMTEDNFIVAFGMSTMGKTEEDAGIFAHEIGHCFGLIHTFAEGLFPSKPIFNPCDCRSNCNYDCKSYCNSYSYSDCKSNCKSNCNWNTNWNTNAIDIDSGEHYKCHSGTMDNVMDYTNPKNSEYKRIAFYKYQWENIRYGRIRKVDKSNNILQGIIPKNPDNDKNNNETKLFGDINNLINKL